jgi:hypothetical protein
MTEEIILENDEKLSEEALVHLESLEKQSDEIKASFDTLADIYKESSQEVNIDVRRKLVERNLTNIVERERKSGDSKKLKEAENRLFQAQDSRTLNCLKKKRFALTDGNLVPYQQAINDLRSHAFLKMNIDKVYAFKNPQKFETYLKMALPEENHADIPIFCYAFYKFISEKKNFHNSVIFINNTIIGMKYSAKNNDEFSKELVASIIDVINFLKNYHNDAVKNS